MRTLVVVVVLAGSAHAKPTTYPAPVLQASSTPTAGRGGALIKGRVVRKDSTPVPYFGLMIQKHGQATYMSSPIAVRDLKGDFHFKDVEAGTWKVLVVGPGFTQATTADLVLSDGKTTDAGTITVETGNDVSGNIVDGAGRPVPGAKICADTQRGGMTMSIGTVGGQPLAEPELVDAKNGKQCTIADKRGRYALSGIPSAPVGKFPGKPPSVRLTAQFGAKSGTASMGFVPGVTLDITIK